LYVSPVFLGQPVPEFLEPDPFPYFLPPLEFQAAALVQAAGEQRQFHLLSQGLPGGQLLEVEVKLHRKIVEIPTKFRFYEVFR
jgi:hypothetical protein